MRITDGDNPLDATSVHPESYEATMKLLDRLDLSMEDVKKLQAESKRMKAGLKQQAAAPAKPKPQKQKQVVIRIPAQPWGKRWQRLWAELSFREEKRKKSAAAGNVGGKEILDGKGAAAASLERRVKDKGKMAQELGIGGKLP